MMMEHVHSSFPSPNDCHFHTIGGPLYSRYSLKDSKSLKFKLYRASMLKEDASPSKSTWSMKDDRNRTAGVHLRRSTAC